MFIHFETEKKSNERQAHSSLFARRSGHKSPDMKRPRLNRTENNKEDTAEECGPLPSYIPFLT